MNRNNTASEPAKPQRRSHRLSIGSWSIEVSDSRLVRMGIGIAFIIGGFLWFLPVLGMWMIPVGVFMLSIDLHWARRLRRRFVVWLTRRYPKLGEKLNGVSHSRLPEDEESR